jgi:hypothetical protein
LVNRIWKLFFGEGICRSVDDLGSQGQLPSHPELIDQLAVDLIESGWDVKQSVRSIVLSRTYRQSSQPRPELADVDPDNRLLARQARFRLDAELVRDNALAVSGLLVPTVGGPSVKPYQPAGYYAQLNFPTRTYQADRGDQQYRRGLYSHWQRTFLHPMLKAFDAPSREECAARRTRSNTPLQALALLNDPSFVEAARALAERIVRRGTHRLGLSPRLIARPAERDRRCAGPTPRKAPRPLSSQPGNGEGNCPSRRATGTQRHRTGRIGCLDFGRSRAVESARNDHPILSTIH